MYKLLKSFTKCKIVYTVHNVLPHNYKEKDIAGYKKIYNLVDYLIVHTEKSKQELISELGINQKKIHVIQHGPIKFDVDEQQLADKKKEFIETLGLDGKIVFSLMGSQSFYKGTDLLYNVWCETPGLANNTDIVCIIAGKPDATICIDYRLKPNNLLFLNRSLDYCEFQAIMELTNVAILPYRDISQSGILLSLVESNIPYCATPVGELLKPLTISNIAWAFDGINKNDIANKIIEISSDKDAITAKKSDVEGWNKVKLFYSWEKAGQLTSEIYEN
jgi:glycosyltransferase involved in cell wall biosynthesis